ncbi:hypothetical protein EV645_0984 [Kribbella rubisoli]|uniref:DUF7674 domain-containing protein n=1 Tax=Kribbella rubisoli TaxID=3075929 RepID=A0A4Q7X837_9ACTN|nr:hypothetical protein EV645_0984 [Kribbella rubisoli]
MAAIGALVDEYRELTPVLAEHLEDNEGEILPHLVLADVVRWLAARVDSDRDICSSILNWLEREYLRGPEDVRGLIAVSGVEMIPDPGQPGSALRQLLGPSLREVDSWLV